MNVKEVIGHRIKYTLNARGMEDKELAKILEVTDETAFDYLHGWRDITAEQIITVTNALNISADYLLGTYNKSDDSEMLLASEIIGLSYESVLYLLALKICDRGSFNMLDQMMKCRYNDAIKEARRLGYEI